MLKFFFWILALGNAALFAYQRGAFDMLLPSGHEPARISNQLNADKIKVVPPPTASHTIPPTASAATAAAAPATPATTPAAATPDATSATVAPAATVATVATVATANAKATAPATTEPALKPVAVAATMPEPVEKKPKAISCAEIGNFNAEDAKRFSAQLDALELGEHARQRTVREVVSHIVYIPPLADKESAEKKAEELRHLGVDDFFIIQDNSNLRWGISLGVFKMEETARAHLANLNEKGVRSARIGERAVSRTVAIQVRDVEADKKAALTKLMAGFPKQEMRRCEAS